MALFRTFPTPPSQAARLRADLPSVPFPRTIALDPYTGRVVSDARGRPVYLDGDAAYRQFVWKVLATQRAGCVLYDDSVGVDRAGLAAIGDVSLKRATFERECRATLHADARTASVTFAWGAPQDDLESVSICVVSVRGARITEDVTL